MAVSAIPEGFHTVTPYLLLPNGEELIGFLKQAFQAVEEHRSSDQNGRIIHAQLKIGDSMVMLSDAQGDAQGDDQPMPAMLYLYVDDVDLVFQRAVQAGACVLREPMDQDYGDRSAGVQDAGGNQWWIATRKETVPPDELMRRQDRLASSAESSGAGSAHPE